MSKISVQFDTVSKDLDVTLDGEKVAPLIIPLLALEVKSNQVVPVPG